MTTEGTIRGRETRALRQVVEKECEKTEEEDFLRLVESRSRSLPASESSLVV